MAEVLYTVAEVAKLWRVSDETVYRRIRKGELRTCDLGAGRAYTRIPESALADFVAKRTRSTRDASAVRTRHPAAAARTSGQAGLRVAS